VRNFSGEQFDLVNGGRLGEEFAGFGHQGFGDGAVEMCLAGGFGFEGVEDAVGAFVFLEGVPGDCAGSFSASTQRLHLYFSQARRDDRS